MPHQIADSTSRQIKTIVDHDFRAIDVTSTMPLPRGKFDLHYHNVVLDIQSVHDVGHPDKLTMGVTKDTFETYGNLITTDGNLSQDSEWALFDKSGQHDTGEFIIATGVFHDNQRGHEVRPVTE